VAAQHARCVRIFTPGGEIPFAGHPTVGTAHVLAVTGELPLAGSTTRVVLEEGVGPVPVLIRAERVAGDASDDDGDDARDAGDSSRGAWRPVFAQLTTAKLPELGPPPPDSAALAEVLTLDPSDLADDGWAPAALSCGLPYLFVPLRSRDAVRRARVRLDRWEDVLRDYYTKEIFVFALGAERAGSDVRARMFAPAYNVPEDPATGSACAALAGYLAPRMPEGGQTTARAKKKGAKAAKGARAAKSARSAQRATGAVRGGAAKQAKQRTARASAAVGEVEADGDAPRTLRWVVEQGFEMGRPSIIDVEADVRGGAVTAVRVGGRSVLVSEGTITIP
jgi:trans-2,3-dihydro-3-hydroxyanthranilate isomerase